MSTTIAPAEGDTPDTENYTLPCAEALLAGTLAVMTGHMQACCDGHRNLMVRKAVANLAQLSQHPLLSPDFKALLWQLRGRWEQQLQAQARQAPMWHASPNTVH